MEQIEEKEDLLDLILSIEILEKGKEMADLTYKHNSLKSKELHQKEMIDGLKKAVAENNKIIKEGFEILEEFAKQAGNESIKAVIPCCLKRIKEFSTGMMRSYLVSKGLVEESTNEELPLSFTEEEIAGLPKLIGDCHQLLLTGNTKKAFPVFKLLVTAYPMHPVIASDFINCVEKVYGPEPAWQLYTDMAPLINDLYFYLEAADFNIQHKHFEEAKKALEIVSQEKNFPEEYKSYFESLQEELKKGG